MSFLPTVDWAQAAAVCKQLVGLPANDDSEAVDFMDGSGDLLCVVVAASPFRAIEKATKDYDFEKALELLREQVKGCGVEL